MRVDQLWVIKDQLLWSWLTSHFTENRCSSLTNMWKQNCTAIQSWQGEYLKGELVCFLRFCLFLCYICLVFVFVFSLLIILFYFSELNIYHSQNNCKKVSCAILKYDFLHIWSSQVDHFVTFQTQVMSEELFFCKEHLSWEGKIFLGDLQHKESYYETVLMAFVTVMYKEGNLICHTYPKY